MNRRSGYMLIEFAVWFGLTGLIFAAFLAFETFARRNSFETSARIEAIQHGEQIVRRVTEDASRALSCQVAGDGVILEIPASGADGEALEGVRDVIIYTPRYEDGGALFRTVSPGEGSAAKKEAVSIARYLNRMVFTKVRGGAHPVLQATMHFDIPVTREYNLERSYSFSSRLENCRTAGGGR